MEDKVVQINEEGKTKRGRKPKNLKEGYLFNKEQTKFFVDLSKEKTILEKVGKLLTLANDKRYGRVISFKDLIIYSIGKINEKDIQKIKELSLSEMEKVQIQLDEYNKKNNSNLSIGEFLVKKLGIK